MKLFYINVIEQNAGWGAECFVNRGFLVNGHETITLDYKRNIYDLSRHFLNLKEGFDALFLQRGDYFPVQLLSAVNRPRFFWASELVSRNRDQDRLFKSGLFEHIFVRTNGCIDTVVGKGWFQREKMSVLLSGFDEQVHFKVRDVEKDIDVLFVGAILPRRRRILDDLNKRVKVTEARAFGREMAALFNRAKIVLNIHAEDYSDTETRVYETLGCGAFLLSEKLSPENPFTSGEHLIEAGSVSDMEEKVMHYLKNEDERERIAESGHKEALAKHTYTKRAEYIASVMSPYVKPDDTPTIDLKRVKRYSISETPVRMFYRGRKRLKEKLRRLMGMK